jgi:hypothetical protein
MSLKSMWLYTLVLSLTVACGGNLELATSDHENSSVATQITLNGSSITVNGSGAEVDGSKVTVVAAGTYNISGSLDDGQIIVDTEEEEPVTLILNGVTISSSTSAPIYIEQAEETVILLEENTENTVSDGAAADEADAAIFSKSNLTFSGSGKLTVNGTVNDGISSNDGLTIQSGTITVNSVDDGIRGKDYLIVKDGHITVNSQGDGLKSDNEEDTAKGYITIENGIMTITAGGDAVSAQTSITVSGGELSLSSGGGSNNMIDETTSAKGIKADVSVTITRGTFIIDSADDAIHSNNSIVINGGTFTLGSGDDAVHAHSTLEVNGGDVTITQSYEGMESAVITINDGNMLINASDDGLNVAGGTDGSGTMRAGPGGRPGQGLGPGQDAFAVSGDYFLYINGGTIQINAAGDGIDVGGIIEMTGGLVLVNGPTENMNGALDYDGEFTITGGSLVAAGSAGMAQAPSESSSQYSLLLNFESVLPAGTLVHIQDSAGNNLLTFSPVKDFQSIAFSSPALVAGTYAVYYGGSSTGTVNGSLYQDGIYTPGTTYTSFTVSSVVTLIGNGMFRR